MRNERGGMILFYKFIIKFFLVASVTSVVTAAEVYRTVDKNGNMVFSDKKTQDAEAINVQPNVTKIETPDMPVKSTQGKPDKSATSLPTGGQQEMNGWNANNGGNLQRRVRTQTNGEGVNRPNATAAPARRAGGR